MAQRLESIRLEAVADVQRYVQAATQKAAADRQMVEGSKQVAGAIDQTDQRLSQRSSGIETLKRKYVEGYREQQEFTNSVRRLDTALAAGKVSTEQYGQILDGLARRYSTAYSAARQFADEAERARAQVRADAAQQQFNTMLGVRDPSSGAAAQSAAVFEEQARATAALERETRAYIDRIDPGAAIQRRFNERIAEADKLLKAGAITTAQHAAGTALAQHEYDEASKALQALGVAAAGSRRHMETYGSTVGLTRMQLLTLQYTVNDVVASLASGTSPLTILLQQGGQVTQAFGGLRGTIGALVRSINPVYAGLALVAGGFALATARAFESDAQIRRFDVTLRAFGNTAGITGAQLRQLSRDLRAQGATTGEAGGIASALARARELPPSLYSRVGGLSLDIGAGTGQAPAEVAAKIVDAFQKGATAIKALDDQFQFLTIEERRQITVMAEHGDQAGALAIAVTALERQFGGSFKNSLSESEKASRSLGNAWDNLLESLSKTTIIQGAKEAIAGLLNGTASALGDVNAQIASLEERIRLNEMKRGIVIGPFARSQIDSQLAADRLELQRLRAGQGPSAATGRAAARDAGAADATGLDATNAAQQRMTKYVDDAADAVRRQNESLRANADVRDIVRARIAAEDEANKNNITGAHRARLIALRENEAREKLAATIRDQTRAINDQIAAQNEAAKIYVTGGLGGGLEAEARAQARRERLTNPNVDIDRRTQEILREQAANENLAQAKALEATRRSNANLAGVAAAGGNPAALEAARRQAEANERFATAEALGVPNVDKLKEAWIDAAKAKADYDRQIQANSDRFAQEQTLELLQKEYELLGQSEAVRERELALLREKQRLIAQGFEGAALDEELAKRRATVEETARLTYEINAAKEADRDFRQAARQGLLEIVSGFEDALTHARSFKDVIHGLGDSLVKLGNQVFIEQPLARWLDRQLSGYGGGGQGGGGLMDWLQRQLGLGGAPSGRPGTETTPIIAPGYSLGRAAEYGATQGENTPPFVPAGYTLPEAANANAADVLGRPAADLSAAAGALSGAGKALDSVPAGFENSFQNLIGRQFTSTVYVQAGAVYVSGGAGASLPGAGGGAGLFDVGGLFGPALSTGTDYGIAEGFFESGAMILHSGGEVGRTSAPRRSVPSHVFRGAPRLHSGLAPDEFPAILQAGERVLSRDEVRRERRDRGNVQIHFHLPNVQDTRGFKQSMPQFRASLARAAALGRRGL